MAQAQARPKRRSALADRLTFAAGAVSALLALALIPASVNGVGPATIATSAAIGAGRTVLKIPPLGTITARTHAPPLQITLSLEEVDLPALGPAVAGGVAREELVAEVEADLRKMVRIATIRLLIGGLAIGALVGALLPARRWPVIAGAAGGGLAVVAALTLSTGIDFDPDAFREPRFTGSLSRAPAVIETLQESDVSLADIGSHYETASERLSDLLALLADPEADPRTDTTALLHVSDVHSNPIGIEITRQLARQFAVEAIIDTGDLTSFGIPLEASIGNLIETIRVPYYFVPGNHDSDRNVRALDRVANITVVDRETIDIAGIEILGWADPTNTTWNKISTEEANEIKVEESSEVAEVVETELPDVLAVHDTRLAEASQGQVPLVLAGHAHERDMEEGDETLTLVVGSTGATGLSNFTVDGDMEYEAQVLYFRGTTAIAVDYIRFSGLGADFVIERTTLTPDEDST